MSKRKIQRSRKGKSKVRGYKIAGIRKQFTNLRDHFVNQRRTERRQAKIQAIDEKQSFILKEYVEELGYKFSALQVTDGKENTFKEGLQAVSTAAQEPWAGRLEAGEQLEQIETDALASAVAVAVTAYLQQCIDNEVLIPRNLKLLETPRARVYASGRVEAASPHDPDVRAVVQRLNDLWREAAI